MANPPPLVYSFAMCRLFFALLLVSAAAAAEPRLLSVLELRNKLEGVDKKSIDGGYLTDRIRAEVLDAELGIQVMTRENMLVLLQAQGKTLANCEGECEVDTARRLGADYVISGDLLRVGALLKASLKLHDTKNGTLLGAVSASGADVDALDASLTAVVHRLVAALKPAEAAPARGRVAAPLPAPPAALPQAAAAPPPARTGPRSHTAAFALGGTALAAAATGGVFGLLSHNAGSALSSSRHDRLEVQALADKHHNDAIAADVLFAAAAAALGLAGLVAW